MRTILFTIIVIILLTALTTAYAQEDEEWIWYEAVFGDSLKPEIKTDSIPRTRQYLDSLIERHQQWLANGREGDGMLDLRFANLSRTNLWGRFG